MNEGNGRERLREAGVVVVVPSLDVGRTATRVARQAKALRAAVGHLEVCGFARLDDAVGELEAAGVEVHVLGDDPAARGGRTVRRLRRHLRKARPEIVHARGGPLTLGVLAAARDAKVPVRVADTGVRTDGGRPGRRRRRRAYRLATDVVASSDATARQLVEVGNAPPAKVARVYGMVTDDFFTAGRRPAGTGQVLSVGRLVPEKGYDLLLDAVGPILRGSRFARLRIAGEGPQERELVMLARKLGIGGQVELLGPRSDVTALLATADLFVMPSRSEGFASALVEAMAMRVPVVATAVGGVPEVLAGVAPEWMVPPDDPDALGVAVARSLALGDRSREILTDRLHARASDFTTERHVAALEALYAAALSRH